MANQVGASIKMVQNISSMSDVNVTDSFFDRGGGSYAISGAGWPYNYSETNYFRFTYDVTGTTTIKGFSADIASD